MSSSSVASFKMTSKKSVNVTPTPSGTPSARLSRSRSRNRSLITTASSSRALSSSGSESELSDLLMDTPVKSRFTASNYLKASQIIRSITNQNPGKEDTRPMFWSDEERILTYELTVAILKHSSFLKDALEKSHFYSKYPKLRHLGQEELLVILYDLIERDFRTSPEDPELPEAFAKLQKAILGSKTKLMAHIAKLRIKHEATSLENLLPTNLKQKQTNIDKNPLYIWVNLKKISEVKKIVNVLSASGLRQTMFEDDTLIQDNLFNVNQLHPDLIRLNSEKTNMVKGLPIYRDGYIVVQDKSACLPVYVLTKAIYFKEAINHRGAGMEHLNPFPTGDYLYDELNSSGEEWFHGILEGSGKYFSRPESVVVTHCGLGRSAAHLAILLSEAVPRYLSKSGNMTTTGADLAKALKSKFVYRAPLNVIVFGTPKNKHHEISSYVKKVLGITNIKLYSEDFLNVSKKDSRIRGCGAILVNPPSSGSALKDPVSYICSEGGDEKILNHYSQFVSSATLKDDNGNAIAYTPHQTKYLSHALSIPNVKLVLYTTCSNLACENSDVVRTCMSEARRREEARKCKIYASIVMQSQSKLFREVKFELVNMENLIKGYDVESCLTENYVDMQPSSACSGVFMALIRRKDNHVNMAKKPVKEYVTSQIKVWAESSTGSGLGLGTDSDPDIDLDFSELISLDSSGRSSQSNLLASQFTEEELAQYMIRKLKLDSASSTYKIALKNSPSSQEEIDVDMPVFKANMKKKNTKKAIVKRVSTPTHSSLQRQTEKFYYQMSNPTSGTQTPTPRSGTRTPITILSTSGVGVGMGDATNNANSNTRPTTAVSGKSTPRSKGSAPGGQGYCPHHHGHGHVCVCARHAKKFPDMLKNL